MSSVWGHLEWHVENENQFWAELEDILHIPKRPTLEQLDNSLLTYIKFCAQFQDPYLLLQRDFNHALGMVLHSVLFKFHSTRMIDLLLNQVGTNDSPSCIFMIYSLLLEFGHRSPALYRDLPRWRTGFPSLIAVLERECEDKPHESIQDTPMASRIRLPSALLLYEVCRVQKLAGEDLELFTETFIDHLFELVERTRLLHDETLNYALIKLLVALNEQFMVATLAPSAQHVPVPTPALDPNATNPTESFPFAAPSTPSTLPDQSDSLHPHHQKKKDSKGNVFTDAGEAKRANRVLAVLMGRLGASKTFGENMIFMLNRAENTPEDLCMQLLILKILYLLFTTSGTKEYFYTNDLKVLVDVFIRELSDLPEESEALRHTYLRVLHPLLTNTQLRTLPTPYKRPNLLRVLDAQIANPYGLREIGPTTQRLVDRCLSGSWCGREKEKEKGKETNANGRESGKTVSENGKGAKAGLGVETMTSLAETLGVAAQVEGEENELTASSPGPSRSTSSLVPGSNSSASSLHKSISRLSVDSSSSSNNRLVVGPGNGSSLSLNSVAGATAPSRARIRTGPSRTMDDTGGSAGDGGAAVGGQGGLDNLEEGVRLNVSRSGQEGSDGESRDEESVSSRGGTQHLHPHRPKHHQVHQHDAFRTSHSPLQPNNHASPRHLRSSSLSSSSTSSSHLPLDPYSSSYVSTLTASPQPSSPSSLPSSSPPRHAHRQLTHPAHGSSDNFARLTAAAGASLPGRTRRKPPPPPVDRSNKALLGGGGGPPPVDRSTKGRRTPVQLGNADGEREVRVEDGAGARGEGDRGWETFS